MPGCGSILARRHLLFTVLPALAAAALGGAPGSAHAEDAPLPAQGSSAGPAPAKRRVEWSPDWPRFRWWEYGGTAVIGGLSIYLYRYVPPPEQPKWTGNNAFDDTIRDWFRADSRGGRESAGSVGNVLSWSGAAVPFVIDLPVIWFVHRQPGVAWQVLMMDLEAEAVSGFIKNLLFVEAGRARPSFHDCAADPSYDALCGSPSNNASFPSGHTVNIATSAGLVCVHHRYLPIYGQPAADAGVCALMSAATVVTAVTRTISDRHFATDSIFGAVLGFGAGYGLPWLLHYRAGASAPPGGAAATTRPVLLPIASGSGLGLGLLWAM
jgi:membrane-associated phospholipid phosphatase